MNRSKWNGAQKKMPNDGGKLLGLLVLGGAGLWLYSRTAAGAGLAQEFGALETSLGFPGRGPGNAPAQRSSSPGRTGSTAAGSAGALSGAAGLAAAGPIGWAIAGVGLLAWGITDKGWFRGGEEGVKVNPARDQLLSQFAKFDYMRDSKNPPGFYGLANILTIMGAHDMFDALMRSDTMAEYSAAVAAIADTLASASPAQLAQATAASKYA